MIKVSSPANILAVGTDSYSESSMFDNTNIEENSTLTKTEYNFYPELTLLARSNVHHAEADSTTVNRFALNACKARVLSSAFITRETLLLLPP